MAQVGLLLPNHDELDVPNFQRLVYVEPGEFEDDAIQEAAERGYGAFFQANWTEYGKPKLYPLARATWEILGCQTMAPWIKLFQTVLDSFYADHWPNTNFETPNNCAICLLTMHWAEKTVCGHVFHLHCLMRLMDTKNSALSIDTPVPCSLIRIRRRGNERGKMGPLQKEAEWVERLDRSIDEYQSFKPILPFFSWIHSVANVEADAFHRWEEKRLFCTQLYA
ncbi:hypothetical protein NPIL_479011 [Nephila pilipes]|uniref:RING-type domain-containing protein n=1 Tax=Nephila pilipes TaxID=299642 RepID=A0A8X6Q2I1_NEPPI|nr:hypothetical protein NPIL_479011 [Nephila pilipes]